jgi:hypothetical protein
VARGTHITHHNIKGATNEGEEEAMAHLTHLRQRYTEKIESSRENRVGGGE